jgi:hypothetical protein
LVKWTIPPDNSFKGYFAVAIRRVIGAVAFLLLLVGHRTGLPAPEDRCLESGDGGDVPVLLGGGAAVHGTVERIVAAQG